MSRSEELVSEAFGEGARRDGGWPRRVSWRLGKLADGAMRVFARLAKRLKYPALATVPVSAAMLQRVETVDAGEPLANVARLFVAGRVAELPVVDHGALIGVLTRDAVAHALASAGPDASVGQAECRNVFIVAPSDSLVDVLARLRATPDAVALVVDHGAPVGLLTAERLAAYAASVEV